MREQLMSLILDAISREQKWECLVTTVVPHESLTDARRRLLKYMERGQWELQHSVHYHSRARCYWTRRRTIHVASTL